MAATSNNDDDDHSGQVDITEPQQPSIEKRAYDLMLEGRLLNSGDELNQEAFNLLSKAIKLNPYLIGAWIQLSKFYQRKLDITGAIACLENALKYCDSNNKSSKIILRKLSICIRQKTDETQEARIASLLKSLELSKQALKSDMFDEENYYNLAKAYMCLFFATECVDQQLINLSKAAFVKALALSSENRINNNKDPKESKEELGGGGGDDLNQLIDEDEFDESTKPFNEQSDFLFNFSTVLVYLQEFQKALEYLRLAISLDKEWDEPKLLEESLVDYLNQIHLMLNDLSKNDKKVVKRYGKIVDSLKNCNRVDQIILLDQQRLEKSTNLRIETIKSMDELEKLTVNEQVQSKEKNSSDGSSTSNKIETKTVRLLHLKLVNTINYNQAMYLTFIAIDQNYSVIVVTIYNLAASRCPTPKDVVTVVDPKIEEIVVENLYSFKKDSNISFKRISIREFKSLYVNGSRITTDQVSKPQFKISVIPN